MRTSMVIYSRPLYSEYVPGEPLPRTIAVEVSVGGASTWTLVYDNGTHRVIKGREQVELHDRRLTTTFLQSYYLISRKA